MANFEDIKTNNVNFQEVLVNDVHYNVYFLYSKDNTLKKVSFINDDNVRFEFNVKDGKRKEGQSLYDFLENIIDNLSDKIPTPEELKMNKKLNEYAYFITMPDGQKTLGGLKKDGAKLMQVISDNPFLLDRVKSKELKKIFLNESPKLIANRPDINRVDNYKGQEFYCEYIFNQNQSMTGFKISYTRNDKEVVKEYKLDIYKLRNAILELQKVKDPADLVKMLRDPGIYGYKRFAIEAIIQYNKDYNVKFTEDFDLVSLKNFKIYKRPTLMDVIESYSNKRFYEHFEGVLKQERRRMTQEERLEETRHIVDNSMPIVKFLNSGSLDEINGMLDEEEVETDTFFDDTVEEDKTPVEEEMFFDDSDKTPEEIEKEVKIQEETFFDDTNKVPEEKPSKDVEIFFDDSFESKVEENDKSINIKKEEPKGSAFSSLYFLRNMKMNENNKAFDVKFEKELNKKNNELYASVLDYIKENLGRINEDIENYTSGIRRDPDRKINPLSFLKALKEEIDITLSEPLKKLNLEQQTEEKVQQQENTIEELKEEIKKLREENDALYRHIPLDALAQIKSDLNNPQNNAPSAENEER